MRHSIRPFPMVWRNEGKPRRHYAGRRVRRRFSMWVPILKIRGFIEHIECFINNMFMFFNRKDGYMNVTVRDIFMMLCEG